MSWSVVMVRMTVAGVPPVAGRVPVRSSRAQASSRASWRRWPMFRSIGHDPFRPVPVGFSAGFSAGSGGGQGFEDGADPGPGGGGQPALHFHHPVAAAGQVQGPPVGVDRVPGPGAVGVDVVDDPVTHPLQLRRPEHLPVTDQHLLGLRHLRRGDQFDRRQRPLDQIHRHRTDPTSRLCRRQHRPHRRQPFPRHPVSGTHPGSGADPPFRLTHRDLQHLRDQLLRRRHTLLLGQPEPLHRRHQQMIDLTQRVPELLQPPQRRHHLIRRHPGPRARRARPPSQPPTPRTPAPSTQYNRTRVRIQDLDACWWARKIRVSGRRSASGALPAVNCCVAPHQPSRGGRSSALA